MPSQFSFLLFMFQILANFLGLVALFHLVNLLGFPWYANIMLVGIILMVLRKPMLRINRAIYAWVDKQ